MMDLFKKNIAVIVTLVMVLTMIPVSASAASSNKPGKVKLISVKAQTASAKNNKGTVIIKWKKIKGAKGYQIYTKDPIKEKWVLAKKTGKRSSVAKIKLSGGKHYVKVRAVAKRGGRTKYGKFSATKTCFVKSRLTLKKFFAMNKKAYAELKNGLADEGCLVKVSGNCFIMDFDLSSDPEMSEREAKSKSNIRDLKQGLVSDDFASELRGMRVELKNATGITGVSVKMQYSYKGEILASKVYK